MNDADYMKRAITLARNGLGRTAPNPPVGAVVVRDDKVIGEGFHPAAGFPHAEIYALDAAGDATNATIYVTLEPCSHYGKTPPCANAIIKAGISRVVIGSIDPNPLVRGRGVERLKAAGIDVMVGVEAKETDRLIQWFSTWILTSRPYVILKAAITLDGKIAAPGGDSRWISSEESRTLVHEMRNEVDAVVVGIQTVMADNPRLTCRIRDGRDPKRVIIDRDLEIPADALCLGHGCIILTSKDAQVRPELTSSPAEIIQVPLKRGPRFDWQDILDLLGARGVHAIMVEGGSGIFSDILRHNAVDLLKIFVAPKILGKGISLVDWDTSRMISDAYPLDILDIRRIGGDMMIDACPCEKEKTIQG
ncbi:MAG: bifunctional diaminohydroxyphosphoribosylaminopyrimidine deaminase/5-amino-6-(5-phosphoribosylamino)uracil reductase RibD [Thermodesulfobacteriota bacterium]|nr:bifunctional diaminohydroxyphosphoribosylaminopyrimidine deaminase/5-amino-6-(5-phosphoribosylamino)uracil reductase RibD [Thermodesulfobacteriota bacterium]